MNASKFVDPSVGRMKAKSMDGTLEYQEMVEEMQFIEMMLETQNINNQKGDLSHCPPVRTKSEPFLDDENDEKVFTARLNSLPVCNTEREALFGNLIQRNESNATRDAQVVRADKHEYGLMMRAPRDRRPVTSDNVGASDTVSSRSEAACSNNDVACDKVSEKAVSSDNSITCDKVSEKAVPGDKSQAHDKSLTIGKESEKAVLSNQDPNRDMPMASNKTTVDALMTNTHNAIAANQVESSPQDHAVPNAFRKQEIEKDEVLLTARIEKNNTKEPVSNNNNETTVKAFAFLDNVFEEFVPMIPKSECISQENTLSREQGIGIKCHMPPEIRPPKIENQTLVTARENKKDGVRGQNKNEEKPAITPRGKSKENKQKINVPVPAPRRNKPQESISDQYEPYITTSCILSDPQSSVSAPAPSSAQVMDQGLVLSSNNVLQNIKNRTSNVDKQNYINLASYSRPSSSEFASPSTDRPNSSMPLTSAEPPMNQNNASNMSEANSTDLFYENVPIQSLQANNIKAIAPIHRPPKTAWAPTNADSKSYFNTMSSGSLSWDDASPYFQQSSPVSVANVPEHGFQDPSGQQNFTSKEQRIPNPDAAGEKYKNIAPRYSDMFFKNIDDFSPQPSDSYKRTMVGSAYEDVSPVSCGGNVMNKNEKTTTIYPTSYTPHGFNSPPVHGFNSPPVHVFNSLPVHRLNSPPVHGFSSPPVHGFSSPPGHGFNSPPVHGFNPPPVHGFNPPPVSNLRLGAVGRDFDHQNASVKMMRNKLKALCLNLESGRKEMQRIAEELFKINININNKYATMNLSELLENNKEHNNVKVWIALGVLYKYALNLLRPMSERPPSWKNIKFYSDVVQDKVGFLKGSKSILIQLGYTQDLLNNENEVVGLKFPNDVNEPNGERVAEITIDLLIASFEVESITNNLHPHLKVLLETGQVPQSYQPMKDSDEDEEFFDAEEQLNAPAKEEIEIAASLSNYLMFSSSQNGQGVHDAPLKPSGKELPQLASNMNSLERNYNIAPSQRPDQSFQHQHHQQQPMKMSNFTTWTSSLPITTASENKNSFTAQSKYEDFNNKLTSSHTPSMNRLPSIYSAYPPSPPALLGNRKNEFPQHAVNSQPPSGNQLPPRNQPYLGIRPLSGTQLVSCTQPPSGTPLHSGSQDRDDYVDMWGSNSSEQHLVRKHEDGKQSIGIDMSSGLPNNNLRKGKHGKYANDLCWNFYSTLDPEQIDCLNCGKERRKIDENELLSLDDGVSFFGATSSTRLEPPNLSEESSATNETSPTPDEESSVPNEESIGHWTCKHCTFRNLIGTTICEICSKTSFVSDFKPDIEVIRVPRPERIFLKDPPIIQPHMDPSFVLPVSNVPGQKSFHSKVQNPPNEVDPRSTLERLPSVYKMETRPPGVHAMNSYSENSGYAKGSPASYFSNTSSPEIHKTNQPQKSQNFTPKIDFRERDRKHLSMSEYELKKQRELSEQLTRERKTQKALIRDAIELINVIKKAETLGYSIEEVELASSFCEMLTSNIVSWLSTTWQKMKDITVTCFADKNLGELSFKEAGEALISCHGDIQRAMNLCAQERQSKVDTLAENSNNFETVDIIEALSTCKGDENKALIELQRKTLDRVIRIWEDTEDVEILHKRLQNKEINKEERTRLVFAQFNMKSWGRASNAIRLMEMEENMDLIEDCVEAANSNEAFQRAQRFMNHECNSCYTRYAMPKLFTHIYCQCEICHDCMAGNIAVIVKEQNIRNLVCPACQLPKFNDEEVEPMQHFQHIGHEIVELIKKDLLDANVHKMFEEKLRDFSLKSDPNFRWCAHCPEYGFVWEEPLVNKMLCAKCKMHTCFTCKEKWEAQHEGVSCEEFKNWKIANDPENQMRGLDAHLAKNGITCPKCNTRFDLAQGGCLHFSCSNCKYQFCGECFYEFIAAGACKDHPTSGLHAHHPRNCLSYQRDQSVKELQQLLISHEIDFDIEPPAAQAENMCHFMEQKHTGDRKYDEPCGKEALKGNAGLCEKHYKEYLVKIINRNKIDPVENMEVNSIEIIIKRYFMEIPKKEEAESDEIYLQRLRQFVQDSIPLPFLAQNANEVPPPQQPQQPQLQPEDADRDNSDDDENDFEFLQ